MQMRDELNFTDDIFKDAFGDEEEDNLFSPGKQKSFDDEDDLELEGVDDETDEDDFFDDDEDDFEDDWDDVEDEPHDPDDDL